MNRRDTTSRPLLHWDDACAEEIGRETVVAGHGLKELDLTSDDRLVDLLERFPTASTQAFTMGTDPAYPNEWQQGDPSNCSGTDLLNVLRSGSLCLVLKDIANVDDTYRDIIADLYRELARWNPRYRTSDHAADLVLASPRAIQYMNFDARPSIRWQLRGSQEVVIYPQTEHFLHPACVEAAVLDGNQSGLYFEPDFDQRARSLVIESGNMISLPHPTAYRIQCQDELCVWMETNHHTPASLRRRHIAATNRLIGNKVPASLQRTSQSGLIASAKNTLSRILSLDKVVQRPPTPPTVSFRVCDLVKASLADNERQKDAKDSSTINPTLTGLLSSPTQSTFTTAVPEN